MSKRATRRVLFSVSFSLALLATLASPILADEDPFISPNQLCCMGFVYMPSIDKVIMYGGKDSVGMGAARSETWSYNVNTNTWQLVDPGTARLGRG